MAHSDSMPGDNQIITTAPLTHAEGLLSWWALAGVDMAVCEESVDWLKPKAKTTALPDNRTITHPAAGYPDTLSAFIDYLTQSPDLPEKAWPGQPIYPIGPQAPQLMIIVHAPETTHGPDAHFSANTGQLLSRMVQAMGLILTDCYVASLSLTAPPGATIDTTAMDRLVDRMRHHIALVKPRSLLILGDQTSRALMPTENSDSPGNLPFVNHKNGTVPAISIIHPRLMLEQPAAKAGAWGSMQRLMKGWEQ